MIYALALASNQYPAVHLGKCLQRLSELGNLEIASIFVIPCRDGIGADYWNTACLLTSKIALNPLLECLKQYELETGRIRPSHHISLDIDLIAWGDNLQEMQFNPKKLPLALDVKIPLYELWQHAEIEYQTDQQYPRVVLSATDLNERI